MTKDLALAIHGKEMQREHWVITDVYMDEVNVRLFSSPMCGLSKLFMDPITEKAAEEAFGLCLTQPTAFGCAFLLGPVYEQTLSVMSVFFRLACGRCKHLSPVFANSMLSHHTLPLPHKSGKFKSSHRYTYIHNMKLKPKARKEHRAMKTKQ